MTTSITTANVRDFLNRIPVLSWPNTAGIVGENLTSHFKTDNSPPHLEQAFKVATSAAGAYLIRIERFAILNGGVGAMHLGLGFAERFRTEKLTKEQWESIAINIHKGCTHLITAARDWAIAYGMRYHFVASIAGVVVFSILRDPSNTLLNQTNAYISKAHLQFIKNYLNPDQVAEIKEMGSTSWIDHLATLFTYSLLPPEPKNQQSIFRHIWTSIFPPAKPPEKST